MALRDRPRVAGAGYAALSPWQQCDGIDGDRQNEYKMRFLNVFFKTKIKEMLNNSNEDE